MADTAGVGHSALLVDESVDDWDRVMAINTRGPWLVMRAMAQAMIEASMLGRAPRQSGWLEAVRRRTPLGRLGRPEDIARAIRALHDLDWVAGQVLDCDGGLALHSPIDAFDETPRSRR